MPDWLRKILLTVFLIAIIAGSFWVSFLIGKQMLVPAKPLPPKITYPQEQPSLPEPNVSNISIEVESTVPLPPPVAIPAPQVKKVVKPKVVLPKKEVVPKETTAVEKTEVKIETYEVQVGYFRIENNATTLAADLKSKGFNSQVSPAGSFYRVTVGNFDSRETARQQVDSLKAAGFDAIIR